MSQIRLQKTQSTLSAVTETAAAAALRVIIVDDDPIFRSLAAAKFLQSAGEVVEAEDGSVGWYRISTETFHLAIVDLDMPNMGGIDLIRCVRGHPRTTRLPIVVVTSRSPAEAMQQTLECGATSFVCKPVNWSMFSKHIDGLMELYGAALRGSQAEDALQVVRALHEEELRCARREAMAFAQSVMATSRMALNGVVTTDTNVKLVRALNEVLKTAARASPTFLDASPPARPLGKPDFAA